MSDTAANNTSITQKVKMYYAATIKYRGNQYSVGYIKKEGLLLYALSGSCVYVLNGKKYQLKAGEIMWSPPNVSISTEPNENDPIHYRNFRFEINDPLLSERLNNVFPPIKVDASLKNMLDYIYDNWKDKSSDNQAIISAFSYSILNLFLLDQSRVKNDESTFVISDSFSPATQKLLVFLEANVHSSHTLEETGQILGYNPHYLSSIFSKELGFTVRDYINFLRIRICVVNFFFWLLNISAVSYRLHFNSISHFSRTFKKYVGIPPSDFYKACCSLSADERSAIIGSEPIFRYRALPHDELFDALHHMGDTMKKILIEKSEGSPQSAIEAPTIFDDI